MAEMMQATTANSSSIHFGFGHWCETHNCLFDLDHIKTCDQLIFSERIPEFAAKLKETPFIEWDLDLKYEAIKAFAFLVAQLHNLTENRLAEMVNTRPAREYVKTGRKKGRRTNAEKLAETNTTLLQFYRREGNSQ